MDLRGPAAGQVARAAGSMREVSSHIAPGALMRASKPPDAKVAPTVAEEVDEEQANREEIERRILAAFEEGDLETAEQLGAMIQAMGSRFKLDQKLPRMPRRANDRDGVARRMRDLEGALDSDDDLACKSSAWGHGSKPQCSWHQECILAAKALRRRRIYYQKSEIQTQDPFDVA